MENSKIVEKIMSDENLSFIGAMFAVLGFYVIAEEQIIGGLLIVVSGYGIILVATYTTRRFAYFLFLKLKALNKRFSTT